MNNATIFFTSTTFGCASSFFYFKCSVTDSSFNIFCSSSSGSRWCLPRLCYSPLRCKSSAILAVIFVLAIFLFYNKRFFLRVFLSISAAFSKSILPCKSLINLFVIVTIMSGTKSVLSVSSSFVKSVFGDYGIW